MDKELTKKLVVFSILMENDEGICTKAPSYIMEKYEKCMETGEPEALLDMSNLAKYDEWVKDWIHAI